MEKKESYRNLLPHFQQPGQAYFVTWNLEDAIPPKALAKYSKMVHELKAQLEESKLQNAAEPVIKTLEQNYYAAKRKYLKARHKLLDLGENLLVDLSKPEHTQVIQEALHFWDEKRLENFAFCIMPNHVHWVFATLEKDASGRAVYLQEITHSVKRYTANRINKTENRQGSLWQSENFDTTIRNDRHLQAAIEYTLKNPVIASLVSHWKEWPGCWCRDSLFGID